MLRQHAGLMIIMANPLLAPLTAAGRFVADSKPILSLQNVEAKILHLPSAQGHPNVQVRADDAWSMAARGEA